MAVDSMRAARLFRGLREASLKKQVYELHLPHEVKKQDAFDPSLSNRLVYGNRADWYAAAAMNGFYDVDAPAEYGVRRYLVPEEVNRIAGKNNRNNGMRLY